MHWLVELEGEQLDLDDLLLLFRSPECTVVREGERVYLRSVHFDRDDNLAVHGQSQLLVERINGACALQSADYRLVRVGRLIRVADDGSRQEKTVYTGAGNLRLHRLVGSGFGPGAAGDGGAIEDGGVADDSAAQPAYAERLVSLQQDDLDVARVLSMLQQPSWTGLYHMLETVNTNLRPPRDTSRRRTKAEKRQDPARDWGLIRRAGWATKGEIRRFTQTADSVRALGAAARHGDTYIDPPEKPMTLPDATDLLRRIVVAWVRSKIDA